MGPSTSPFHRGERAVQSMLGVRDGIEPWARKVVRPYLPEEHRDFYAALPFLVVAARDSQGRPWVSLVGGDTGFAHSPDPTTLAVEATFVGGDGLEHALSGGAKVGVLGIELATRRRNRLNGRVSRSDAKGFELGVDQAFGNCPQYIRERAWQVVERGRDAKPARRHATLSPDMAARIRAADTFFIGSGYQGEDGDPRSGMDASHRGGAPGFVRVEGERVLSFPDYAGNNHYNTIGNLVLDARAALTFVDFATGGLLQLTGRIAIDWDSAAVAATEGARRILRFTLDEAIELDAALPLRWSDEATALRPLRVVGKRRESDDVSSFLLAPGDGEPLVDFVPGQYLPIAVDLPGSSPGDRAERTYSLSGERAAGHYRISVKREPRGTVSRFLHDHVEVGDVIQAGAPAGEFVLDHGDRPVVLVSAGIGATPLVSMLHELVATDDPRPVWFIHGARDGRHHALAEEVRGLAREDERVQVHVAYSRPSAGDEPGRTHQSAGRLDGALLASLLPDFDAEFYLCGPLGFMADMQADLEARGVAPARIHTESFGPVA